MHGPNGPKSKNGFSLVEALIATAILTITAYAMGSLMLEVFRGIKRPATDNQIDIFRRNLVALVLNDKSWDQTVNNNPDLLGCLKAMGGTPPMPLSCPPGYVGFPNAREFALYYANGAIVYNSDTSNPLKIEGVTLEGMPCVGFSKGDINLQCPIRFNMKWYALSSGPRPMVAIIATLQFSQTNRDPTLIQNIGRYSIGACNGPMVLMNGLSECTDIKNPLIRSAQ